MPFIDKIAERFSLKAKETVEAEVKKNIDDKLDIIVGLVGIAAVAIGVFGGNLCKKTPSLKSPDPEVWLKESKVFIQNNYYYAKKED